MKLLKYGDRSVAVRGLQEELRDLGFFGGTPDGRFDEETRAAVVAFQLAHHDAQGRRLVRDGIVGPKTRWALDHPEEDAEVSPEKLIKWGDSGIEVREIQRILVAEGFLDKVPDGIFDKDTHDGVVYFQQSHLDANGDFLEVDGVVGPITRWALDHPTGAPQVSDLPPVVPERLTPQRQLQLKIVLGEHNVKEVPNGSNWGPDIEKYGGKPGQPWCCWFWSWGNRQAFGRYSLGRKHGLCRRAWNVAGNRGMAYDKGTYVPIPGDAFVMLYRDGGGRFTGKGHIGYVLRTAEEGGVATAINTVEGNSGNRVKVGRRKLSNADIVGFINPFPPDEQPTDWERGTVKARRTDLDPTR
jgi:peptidoglycan hydrolase-like protein with peptidoglycan-binding domain